MPHGCALDERDERAHGERDAALAEIAADAIERREQPELLVHKPSEPLARDLGAVTGSTEGARRGALAALPAAIGVTSHDAATLVLLDDVKLLFDELVGGVQRGATARGTRLRA